MWCEYFIICQVSVSHGHVKIVAEMLNFPQSFVRIAHKQVWPLLIPFSEKSRNYSMDPIVTGSHTRLLKSLEFGNGSRMSDKNLVILEFKYLQNKTWQEQAVKSARIEKSCRTYWLFSFHSDFYFTVKFWPLNPYYKRSDWKTSRKIFWNSNI